MANLKKIISSPMTYLAIAMLAGATMFSDFYMTKKKINSLEKETEKYKIEKFEQDFKNRKDKYTYVFVSALAVSLLAGAGKGIYNREKQRESF